MLEEQLTIKLSQTLILILDDRTPHWKYNYEDVGMFDCSCDKKRFYVLNVNSAININNINLVNWFNQYFPITARIT